MENTNINTKISVIIPSFKPQEYLWECLNSLNNQLLPKNEFEILVILNGCKEPYKSQILQYIDEHDGLNITLLQTDKGGVSNARNIGLDSAKGQYITFIDDDDYVSPSYLSELLRVSAPNIIGIAKPNAFTDGVNDSQQYRLTTLFERQYPAEEVSFMKLRKYFSGPWMKLIHRDVIGTRRFNVNFDVGEDGLFNFLISDKIKKCTLTCPTAIYYRRYHVGSLVMKKKNKKFIVKNNIKLLFELQKIYFSSPLKYSFRLYIMQSLGCFSGMIR